MIYTVLVVVILLWLWVSFRSQRSFIAEAIVVAWDSHHATEYRDEIKYHLDNIWDAIKRAAWSLAGIIVLVTWPIWFPILVILIALIAAIVD